MKKSPLSALTLILVGAMFTSLNAFAIDGQIVGQASTNIDVTADVEDMIDISPATNSVLFENQGTGDWQESLTFTVRRRGASLDLNTPRLYTVMVTGSASGTGTDFFLEDTNNNANLIRMNINYQTLNGTAQTEAGSLTIDENSSSLTTYIGMNSTASADNLQMTLTIPENQITNARAATYTTDLTIMVAAI